jgi:hypothetical protein
VKDKELARRPDTETALAAPAMIDPMRIIEMANREGMSPDNMSKMLDLAERVQQTNARQQFNAALDAFQSECPPIKKNRKAKITSTTTGSSYSYDFADLEEVVRVVRPVLRTHGLSFSWDMDTAGAVVTCTCILKHIAGHRETARFQCGSDSRAGMSAQQKSASALTYAKRYALLNVLGLVTADPDNDGAQGTGDIKLISEHDLANLKARIDDTGVPVTTVLRAAGIEKLEQMPATRVKEMHRRIDDWIRAKGGRP